MKNVQKIQGQVVVINGYTLILLLCKQWIKNGMNCKNKANRVAKGFHPQPPHHPACESVQGDSLTVATLPGLYVKN